MSRLTAEQRQAMATELLAAIERYREELRHIAIKHELSPDAIEDAAAPKAGWDGAVEALRREAGQ